MNRPLVMAAVVALLLTPTLGQAQSKLDDRFSISPGLFISDWGTETQLNSDTLGLGTIIDFERDLGLDSNDNVFRVDGYYRFNERHRLDFSVFDLSRGRSKAIEEDIQYGDITFVIDTVIDVESDLSVYKLAYTYSFLHREKGTLGATIGAHVADASLYLAEQQSQGQATRRGLTAPLPVIGLRGDYMLSERFTLRGSADFFALELDDVDGSIRDIFVSVDYQMTRHAAIGLGYNYVSIEADATKNDFSGSLDWSYDGALLFLKFDF